MSAEREKLTKFVTVRLDDEDVRGLAILRRERQLRDNGREATHSLVVRDLIREAIASVRAHDGPEGAVLESCTAATSGAHAQKPRR